MCPGNNYALGKRYVLVSVAHLTQMRIPTHIASVLRPLITPFEAIVPEAIIALLPAAFGVPER
jgi:hypothetical protein